MKNTEDEGYSFPAQSKNYLLATVWNLILLEFNTFFCMSFKTCKVGIYKDY